MKWRGRAQSSNVEDRRGQRRRGVRYSGGPRIRMPRGRMTGGGLAFVAIVFVVAIALGVDPMTLLQGGPVEQPTTGETNTRDVASSMRPSTDASEDELRDFVGVVVKETEEMWGQTFRENGGEYVPPAVVLFTGSTASACGPAEARTGPFYCPLDRKVYLDLGFYRQLRDRFGAPGDFAQAYVLAHEIGHHVQNLTGVLPAFSRQRSQMSPTEANRVSVRVELQADCYAGVWANHAGQADLLEMGDVEEALNAADRIGDDVLQKRMQGYAVPKTFDHGTSAQRRTWFERGYEAGDPAACDTFNTDAL